MTEANLVTRVRTIGIPDRDQDKALEFYTTALGLDNTLDVPMGSGRCRIEVSTPGGGTTIALTTAKPGPPASVETGIRLCVGDADTVREHLLGSGVSADEVLRWPGVPPDFCGPRPGRQRARARAGILTRPTTAEELSWPRW